MPWATDSWFDVDPVAVPGGEGARVAGGLREADQQQRDRGDADLREVLADDVEVRQLRRRQPARHVADERDPVRAEVEQAEASRPPTTSTSAPGHRGRREPQPEDHGERDGADERASSSGCRRASAIHDASSRHALSPSDEVPVSFGSSPIDDVDRRARQESGHHGLREELGDPAHPKHARAAGTARR